MIALLGVLESYFVLPYVLISAPPSTLFALFATLSVPVVSSLLALPAHLLNASSLLILTRVVLVLVVYVLTDPLMLQLIC